MADNLHSGTDDEDARLDAALRDYLATRLDGQLGRSAFHFHRHLAGGSASGGAGGAGALGSRRRSPGYGPGGWVVGIVGGALAASIAALWAGPALRLYVPPQPPGTPDAVASATDVGSASSSGSNFQVDELTLCSQTRDAGTVLLGGHTAARRLVRKELKQTRWVDPATGASLEKIEPRQDVMFIQLDTY